MTASVLKSLSFYNRAATKIRYRPVIR